MPVTESANQSHSTLQLVQRALPVSSVDALLECLVDSWLQSSGAAACHVSLVTNQKFSAAFVDPTCSDGPSLLHKHLDTDPNEWSATLASNVLTSVVDAKSELLTTVTVVPFEYEGRSLGGVLLLGNVEDTESLASLAAVSAQLIEQLRNVTASSKQLDPVSETRLRDLKLEAMAEFAAGAGHEINNPVATIAGRSALLLKTETDPERRRILETIGGQAYRIRDMIGDAMTYARPPEPVPEEFSPAEDILQISQSLRDQFSHKQITIETSLDETIKLTADREQFRVVVSCLIKNSLEAISDDGIIRVELVMSDSRDPTETRSVSEGPSQPQQIPPSYFRLRPHFRFAVSDNGVGLSETEREHLFDPFYSGRQAGRGLGFGLSKCWQILKLHDGEIEAVENGGPDDVGKSGLTVITMWPA